VIELSGVGAGSGSGIALGSGTSFSLVQVFQDAASHVGVPGHHTRPRASLWAGYSERLWGRSALSAYVSWMARTRQRTWPPYPETIDR